LELLKSKSALEKLVGGALSVPSIVNIG